MASANKAQCVATLLRVCARRTDGGDSMGGDATGESLVWWHPPLQDTTALGPSVPADVASGMVGHTDLIRCLSTLRESITVSRLRAGIDEALSTGETQLSPLLPAKSFTIEHVRTLMKGEGAIRAACVASRATASLLASPDLWRWTVAATLTYAAAACRLRLCVVDYARIPASALWISDESTCCSDDIACITHFDDGRWAVMSRDDATRTFSRESDLPFALALSWAATERKK